MSKKFKGKTCIYCLKIPSTNSGDHIFAREFFLESRRDNLPKVPACASCNNEKSKLEHYLTAVLPFGGKHSDALVNLQTLVPRRLAKNEKQHRLLASGLSTTRSEEFPATTNSKMTIPFDSDRLHKLFVYIVRGLLWHHWSVTLSADFGITVLSLTKFGQTTLSHFLAMNACKRVREDVGSDTFSYEGVQGTDYPEFSIWRFRIYGGAKLSGDPLAPYEEAEGIFAITARTSFLQSPAFKALFDLPENGASLEKAID